MASDDDLFEQAMADVRPLGDRRRRAVRGRRAAGPSQEDNQPGAASVAFEIETWAEEVTGLAPGVDSHRLAELRRGRPPVERTVDLHGLTRDEARGKVRRFLQQVLAAGCRCVLVVHGRGRRSASTPVIKPALPEWLAAPPHGERVIAFTTAPPNLGGPGATLVLLR